MKKLLKKVMAIGIVTIMVLGLAACGDKDNKDDSSKSGNNEYSNYEAKDLKGRKIRIGIWWDEYWDSNYQSVDEIEAVAGALTDVEEMQMKLDAVRAIEEKWNCKIEWVNLGWDGIQESINTSVVAGTPECDIYLSDTAWVLPAIMNGYAQKFTDYAPKDSDLLTDNIVFTPTAILGQDEYLFHVSSVYPNSATYLAYNKTMIDSLGLEDPCALAERGEWTFDKFAEYAKKCTRDTNGDGINDVFGYGSVTTNTIQGFLAANNAQIAVDQKEGLSSEASIQAFQFIERLYNTDKSARPYQGTWEDDRDSLFNGLTAFSFVSTNELHTSAARCEFDVYVCPAPTGPHGDGSMTPARFVNEYFIPVNVEDATSVYCVFEEMQNWFKKDTSLRDDPEFWETMFATEEQLELGIELGFKSNNDMWTKVDDEGVVHDVMNAVVIDKTSTVAQQIEKNKQILQSEIDMYMSDK